MRLGIFMVFALTSLTSYVSSDDTVDLPAGRFRFQPSGGDVDTTWPP
jgi:hypothetical protein